MNSVTHLHLCKLRRESINVSFKLMDALLGAREIGFVLGQLVRHIAGRRKESPAKMNGKVNMGVVKTMHTQLIAAAAFSSAKMKRL